MESWGVWADSDPESELCLPGRDLGTETHRVFKRAKEVMSDLPG